MLTSGQIAQMMQQQNQTFAGQAAHANTISAQMPGAYSGAPGGGGFSYAQPGGGEFATSMGNRAVSAMGGAAHLGLGVGTAMASMGMLGRGGAALLDPFAGGGAMYRLGGKMGLGMAGRLGMGAIGMAPAAAVIGGAHHAISSGVAGAQEQARVENVLQNNQFLGPMHQGRIGGFSRSQAHGVSDMMRNMAQTPELMTDMGELTRIMDRMGKSGLMSGVRDVEEFQEKFKENIQVLKKISKVVASSMEEALPMFNEIRRSGFYSTGDIVKNAMARQVTGGVTGMNQGQVAQLTSAGSQMSFATGGTRATGSEHALRMANQIGMAKRTGALSSDDIMEMTGKEGAAGVQALAQQLTHAGYRMSRGALGTATSIALAETDEEGRFTGDMDEELLERFRTGGMSKSELMRMARGKTGSRAAKLSYVAHRKRLRSEMAGSLGVTGQLQMLQNVLGERGFNNPDALKIVSQRFGLSEREADTMVDLGKRMPDIQRDLRQVGAQEAKRVARESYMRENYSWDAVKTKAKRKISNAITEPFKEVGADIRSAITGAMDDFIDDVTGRYKVQVSKEMSQLVKESMAGVGSSRNRLGKIYDMANAGGAIGSSLTRGADMSTGMAADAMNWITGNETAGEGMADVLGMMGGGKYSHEFSADGITAIQASKYARDRGYNILSRDHRYWGRDDKFTISSDQQIKQARSHLRALGAGKGSDLSRRAMGLLEQSGGYLGRQLSGELSGALNEDLSIELMEGEERLKAITRAMDKEGSTFRYLKGRLGEGTEADILAAAEKFSGGKIGTGLSSTFSKLAGGLTTFSDLKAVSEKKSEAQENIRDALGGELGEKFIGLTEDSMTEKGLDLVFEGIAGQDEAGRKTSRSILRKLNRKTDLSSEEKQFLKDRGIDISGLKDNPERVKELIEVMGGLDKQIKTKDAMAKAGFDVGGPDITKNLRALRRASAAGSLVGIMEQFREQGESLEGGVANFKKAKFESEFSRDAVTKLGKAAKLLQVETEEEFKRALGQGEGESASELYGQAAVDLFKEGVTEKERRRVVKGVGDANFAAAVDRVRTTKSRYKKGGTTVGQLLPDFDTMSDEVKEKIFDITASGKGEKRTIKAEVDKEELEKLLPFLATNQAGGGLAAGEESVRSSYANPADVAESMTQFSENTAKLAEYVQMMDEKKDNS